MKCVIDVECPACESVYTLTSDEINVLVIFQCMACGQYNAYLAGNVLALDKDIMDAGTDVERRSHIIEILQLWAGKLAGDVLKNVNKVIDINVDVRLQNTDWEAPPFSESREMTRELSTPMLCPTVIWAEAPEITGEEVRDFVRIDLNLIDRKWYFDKFFGRWND